MNKAQTSADAGNVRIRAHIAEQQWGGFVSDFWQYFKSDEHLTRHLSENPAHTVIETELVRF